MIRQKMFDEISQSLRNGVNDRLPSADTKPGTWTSDVIIMPVSDELGATYADLKIMEINQSVLTASGQDLDRIAGNYFAMRKTATKSTGTIRFYVTNTNKQDVKTEDLPASIYIPLNFRVATVETSVVPYVEFITTESVFITRNEILSLLTDYTNNYKYIEVPIEAVEAGQDSNVSSGTILIATSPIEGIDSVANVSATQGGEDMENDISLRFRIMLSVLGASICTKNGYLKYVIQQDYVEDALVVGGGDQIMFRDGGYLNVAGEYVFGRGGMVDIWIRGRQLMESTYQHQITTEYLSREDKDITLYNQPVYSITSITSNTSGYVYENADKYEVEYGVLDNVEQETYFKDILWDFSITDTFPDVDLYPLDIQDATEVEILKKQLDEELKDALNYLENINYNINWSLVTYEDISQYEVPPMFQKVYFNGIPYKIIAVDKRLNGRTFVKRDDRIFLRYYDTPDYILLKNDYSGQKYESLINEDLGGSVFATNRIHWLKDNILQEGDSLNISYTYNTLIYLLQQDMNSIKILTADILMREAYEVPVQILMTCYCTENVDSSVVSGTITTKISNYVNNLLRMGDVLEESTLVAFARDTYGITQVDLDKVSLSIINHSEVAKIQLEANEYFRIKNIEIKVISESEIVI